jgi:two-component system OmpR family sensor kinase
MAQDCWQTVATDHAILDIQTNQTVQADASQLHHLFENLFRNAVEHADEHVIVTIRTVEDGERAGFYVADDGPGIPPAERDKIFDIGYTTAPDGTGFGLHIVEQIADAHD